MKNKLIITLIAVALTITTVKAQDRNNTATGAAVGAIAGVAIGANNHNPLVGALTGALVGGLIGNAIDANTQPSEYVAVESYPPVITTYSNVNYTWGPLDYRGYPEFVYVQVWNGRRWITTYYPYNQFLNWHEYRYGYRFREEEYRYYWHSDRFQHPEHSRRPVYPNRSEHSGHR